MTVLNEACKISQEHWIESIPIPKYTHNFSRRHKKSINTLFDKMRGGKYHKLTRNSTKFAIAIAVILSITTVTVCAVETKTHIIQNYFNHSSYSISNSDEIFEIEELRINNIPNGYVKDDEFISEQIIKQRYVNNENWFAVTKATMDIQINFDTENYDYKEIERDGIEYTLYKSNNNTNGLIWNNNLYVFSIFGTIDEDALLRIAKSIK